MFSIYYINDYDMIIHRLWHPDSLDIELIIQPEANVSKCSSVISIPCCPSVHIKRSQYHAAVIIAMSWGTVFSTKCKKNLMVLTEIHFWNRLPCDTFTFDFMS